MGEIDSIEFLIDKLAATKTNDEFFGLTKRQQSNSLFTTKPRPRSRFCLSISRLA